MGNNTRFKTKLIIYKSGVTNRKQKNIKQNEVSWSDHNN
jgi:hypothetical protein